MDHARIIANIPFKAILLFKVGLINKHNFRGYPQVASQFKIAFNEHDLIMNARNIY